MEGQAEPKSLRGASTRSSAADLQMRLARLRARMAAEGRDSAIRTIDKAIAKAAAKNPKREDQ